MKKWQVVALIALNLAVLPWTLAFVYSPSTYWPPVVMVCIGLPVLHLAVTAIAVNLYLLPRKLRERKERITSPASQRP